MCAKQQLVTIDEKKRSVGHARHHLIRPVSRWASGWVGSPVPR
jgi:hypothetical protein